MTITEQEEADNLLQNAVNDGQAEDGNLEDGENTSGDESQNSENTGNGEVEEAQDSESKAPFYVVDPETGELVDAVTGEPAEMQYNVEATETSSDVEENNTSQ